MTVLEVVQIDVLPGHEEEFEAVLLDVGKALLSDAQGFVEFNAYGWGVERPSVYLFSVRWQTVADHVAASASDRFAQWRDLMVPHFAARPVAEHFQLREDGESA